MDYSPYLGQNAYDSCLSGVESSGLGIQASYGEFSTVSTQPSQAYPYSSLRPSVSYGSSASGMTGACNLASMMEHQQVPQCSPYSSGKFANTFSNHSSSRKQAAAKVFSSTCPTPASAKIAHRKFHQRALYLDCNTLIKLAVWVSLA